MRDRLKILKTEILIPGIGLLVVVIAPVCLFFQSLATGKASFSRLSYPFRWLQSGDAEPYLIPVLVAGISASLLSMVWTGGRWIAYAVLSGGVLAWILGTWVDIIAGMIG